MVPSKCLVIGYSGRGQAGSRDGYPEQEGEGRALALSLSWVVVLAGRTLIERVHLSLGATHVVLPRS